jgi:hypothetical protein
MHDGRLRTQPRAVFGLLGIADDCDHVCSERVTELHGGGAGTPGGTEHREPLAAPEASTRDETEPTGEIRDEKARAVGVAHPRRHAVDVRRASEGLVGEPAVPFVELGDRHDAITDRDVDRDAVADCCHVADHLLSGGEGQWWRVRVRAAAHHYVGERERGRAYTEPHLVECRFWRRRFRRVECGRWLAVPVDLPGPHCCCSNRARRRRIPRSQRS